MLLCLLLGVAPGRRRRPVAGAPEAVRRTPADPVTLPARPEPWSLARPSGRPLTDRAGASLVAGSAIGLWTGVFVAKRQLFVNSPVAVNLAPTEVGGLSIQLTYTR